MYIVREKYWGIDVKDWCSTILLISLEDICSAAPWEDAEGPRDNYEFSTGLGILSVNLRDFNFLRPMGRGGGPRALPLLDPLIV